jgi:hypothetical protein
VHSAPIENEETLHQHISDVYQTICKRLRTFEQVGGGYFEPLL